jgi:hypothetical protein
MADASASLYKTIKSEFTINNLHSRGVIFSVIQRKIADLLFNPKYMHKIKHFGSNKAAEMP